ncbi:MAG: GNAT family N-acetyltransferase [Herpetosiphonaceae bacterium]|nr:GNAT family N-acetyltransferase [Herpetosiphonaceae bacterium]
MENELLTSSVLLRDVVDTDLVIFFAQQQDPTANHMAAFGARDPNSWETFSAHWAKNMAEATNTIKTILFRGAVAGHVVSFIHFDNVEVAYWLGQDYWGQGIATAALKLLLGQITLRPLYACAVKDNRASLRVLEKCGFVIAGEDTGFSHARDQEVEEFILILAA